MQDTPKSLEERLHEINRCSFPDNRLALDSFEQQVLSTNGFNGYTRINRWGELPPGYTYDKVLFHNSAIQARECCFVNELVLDAVRYAKVTSKTSADVLLIVLREGGARFGISLYKKLKCAFDETYGVKLNLDIDCMTFKSYVYGNQPCEKPTHLQGPFKNPGNYDMVFVVDDVAETCKTLKKANAELIEKYGVKNLRNIVLLDKACTIDRRAVEIHYSGFEAPADFLVGYGLDFSVLDHKAKVKSEYCRELPFVAILRKIEQI